MYKVDKGTETKPNIKHRRGSHRGEACQRTMQPLLYECKLEDVCARLGRHDRNN